MTILCYHSVQDDWQSPLAVTREAFREQARWLREHTDVVGLEDAVDRLDSSGRLPAGTTVLTFDDGFAALHDNVVPVLAELRLPAIIFLVAETLVPPGRAVDWVDTPPPFPLQTLTRDQVLRMQDAGVRFASHSWSHLDLTTLSYDECVLDLRRSREALEELLGEPVPFLAYPRGRHDEGVRRATAAAGYRFGFALPQGPEPVGDYAVPRVGVFPGNGLRAMFLKTRRSYLPVRQSRLFPLLRQAVGRR